MKEDLALVLVRLALVFVAYDPKPHVESYPQSYEVVASMPSLVVVVVVVAAFAIGSDPYQEGWSLSIID